MKTDAKIVIPDRVMSRQVGNETVILDLTSGMYFALDPVGARIWQLLCEGQSLTAIVSRLLNDFDVTEDRLRQDVDALFRELVERGLVQVS